MSAYYESVTAPKYLDFKIALGDSIAVLKMNSDLIQEIMHRFNNQRNEYFLYFLDGDEWGKREAWLNNTSVRKFDFETAYDFFKLVQYKDCIAQWADEFIIISEEDIASQIDAVLATKPFTMTKLQYRSRVMSFSTVARMSVLVREYKKRCKGAWYHINAEEMGIVDNGD